MKTVKIVAGIARHLGHGCAVSEEVARELGSLADLAAAFEVAAMAHDQGLEPWQKSTRWTWDGVALSHTTTTGRLKIEATGNSVGLAFFAGPAMEGGEGRLVAKIHLKGSDPLEVRVANITRELLEGRADRLALLREIDCAVCDGAIEEGISRLVAKGNTFAIVLLDALRHVEEDSAAWACARAAELAARYGGQSDGDELPTELMPEVEVPE